MVMDGSFGGVYPITGSHEPCGTIVALGNEVRKGKEGKEGRALREDGMDLDIGDRVVALLPVDICREFWVFRFGGDNQSVSEEEGEGVANGDR
jgi:D-arabinose 1-dehydrogenase-like Zn-dependent alcohol dehydrogenase